MVPSVRVYWLRRAGLVLGVVATTLLASPGHAEDAAAAEAAWKHGIAEMEAGRYETGCPALAESYRLDPRIGVRFSQAWCEARWGKLAAALAHYDDFLRSLERVPEDQRAKYDNRERDARKEREELARRVPYLTITLGPTVPPATTVLKDGVPLGGPLLGVAIPIDPGAHVVRAEAPGRRGARFDVHLAEGERQELVVTFPADKPPPSPHAPPVWPKIVLYGAGAVAVAGLATGTITGLLALDEKSTVEDECDAAPDERGIACRAAGKEAADTGQALALVSTIAFAVAGASVAAGIVALVAQPPSVRAPPRRASWRPRAHALGTRGVLVGAERAW